MSLSVENLLTFSSMKNSVLMAGQEHIDNIISNIVVVEALDISKWVKPGYLLLSSFFAMKDSSDEELAAIVADIVSCRSAALIIKTDWLVADVPPALVAACETYGLPLIKIPEETSYSSIQVEVMQQLFNKKVALLDYFYEMHNRFTEFSLKQPIIPEVLGYLSNIIGNPCALMNSHRNIMYSTDETLKTIEIVEQLPDENKILFSYEASMVRMGAEDLYRQIFIKVPLINDSKQFYLLIVERNGHISDRDYMAIENAVSFLQMLLVQRAAVSNLKQHHMNDMYGDVIGERFDSKQYLEDLIGRLRIKAPEGELFHVVTLYFFRPDNGDLKELIEDFADNIKFVWRGSAYRTRANRINLLLPAQGLNAEEVKKRLDEDVKKILSLISAEEIVYKGGISDASRIDSLKKPNAQSRMIAKKALQSKKSLIADSAEIGLYRFFTQVSKDVDLINLVPERLLLLKQKHEELYDTLRVYLDTNQHIKETELDLAH